MVEWLEWLDDGRHKIVSSKLGFAMRGLEILAVNRAVNGYLF